MRMPLTQQLIKPRRGRRAITHSSAVKVVGGEEKIRGNDPNAGELPGFVLSACRMWGQSRGRKVRQGSPFFAFRHYAGLGSLAHGASNVVFLVITLLRYLPGVGT